MHECHRFGFRPPLAELLSTDVLGQRLLHVTAGRVYGLLAGYVARVYGGVPFYYCSGTYYYPYYINGQTVYVKTTVVSGVPKVPPPPF